MLNISSYSDIKTARTCQVCARQRAENLSILGAKTVLELCVGPSLSMLEKEYSRVGISVVGNDIDFRWKNHYPNGQWIIEDARKLVESHNNFDALVVAPPLSRGCSGKREDALLLEEVTPSYYDFINKRYGITVYTISAKTYVLKQGREQLYKFLACLEGKVEVDCLRSKGTIKYVDVYQIR